MATEVSICNAALLHIGQQGSPISSLTEDSTAARMCATLYPMKRDLLLRAFPWKFATKHQALALVEEEPLPTWGFSYRYPTDCWYARGMLNPCDRTVFGGIPFEVVSDGANGQLIYTDLAEAVLCYTVKITNPAAFDPMFSDALSYLLASDLALAYTKDREIRRETLAIYQAVLGDAASRSMDEAFRDRNVPGDLERARW